MNETRLRSIIREELEEIQEREIPVLLTINEVAAILKKSPGTMNNWRSKGIGPDYITVNGTIRYKKSAVAEFIVNA